MTNTELLKKFDSATQRYLSDIAHTGVTKATLENRTKRLRYLREFIEKENIEADYISVKHIRAFRDSLLDLGRSASTVKQYLVELSAFFSWCEEFEDDEDSIIQSNPVSKKLMPKVKDADKKQYDKILDAEDLKKLFTNHKFSGAKNWERNYAIVTLLLDGKIRNAELLDMKLSDIDFDYGEALVRRGKGDKTRWVVLNKISLSAIKLYLASGQRPAELSDDDYLFGTTAEHSFGGAINGKTEWHRGTTAWLSSLVENHVRNVTGKAGFRSHSMRHNGAVIDLNSGVSMERIQAELGHASIQTTEIYAGKLQSRRHEHNMREVVAVRDEWGERNMETLELA